MSGSAGLSAAKRRRAEQPTSISQVSRQTQPIVKETAPTPPSRPSVPRVVTPMSILEDHEVRLRNIESYIKGRDADVENKVIGHGENKDTVDSKEEPNKQVNDNFKNELNVILTRISELENTNTDLRKKIVGLESDLSSVSNKHSILQTFAMETNASLLKHKDAFEPGVVTRLINTLLDKTAIDKKIAESSEVEATEVANEVEANEVEATKVETTKVETTKAVANEAVANEAVANEVEANEAVANEVELAEKKEESGETNKE